MDKEVFKYCNRQEHNKEHIKQFKELQCKLNHYYHLISNQYFIQGASKLKQAALAFIASHLTKDEEKKDLDKIFKEIDINGDGNLSKDEVLLGYEKHFGIPISEEQGDEMFARIDLDGNGTIDYTEFVMATIDEKQLVTDTRLR